VSPRGEARDVRLRASALAVYVACTHCEWKAEVTTAPWGVDLIRQARLEAFEHCWTAHQIHAWDVSFAVMG
jgi:hypothetical protein